MVEGFLVRDSVFGSGLYFIVPLEDGDELDVKLPDGSWAFGTVCSAMGDDEDIDDLDSWAWLLDGTPYTSDSEFDFIEAKLYEG